MRRARLDMVGDAAPRMRERVVSALADVGVEVVTSRHDSAPIVTLVGFDQASDAVYACVDHAARQETSRVLAVAFTAFSDPRVAWTLLSRGATDVLIWRDAGNCARDIAARIERWSEVDAIVESDVVRSNLVGRSRNWQRTIREVAEVALYTDSPLLISGETGTGKELVARLVHTLDARPDKRELILVDCTTLVPELSGSELFGHERGAFTGAVTSRDGACALADRGTLFLDEIGELPLALQAELLRVVQEGTYKRVGSNNWQRARFRLVCATHRTLADEVRRGTFRRDLFYRIAGVTCTLPALAQRPEDIIPLAEHFIAQARPDLEQSGARMDEPVHEYLLARTYPGNVRDLRQLIARMVARHPGSGSLSVGDIPFDERPSLEAEFSDWRSDGFTHGIRRALAAGAGLREISSAASELAIRIATTESASLRGAARKLGVSERALQMRRAGGRATKAHGASGRRSAGSNGSSTGR